MTRKTGYEVGLYRDGYILQSGLKTRPRAHYHDIESVNGWITRAVVLQTYYADEDTRCAATEGVQRCILCDVRTYGRYQRIFSKVPVLQRTHGLWDTDVYIPRPSSVNLTGGDLRTGTATNANNTPTPAESLDGDHVLIGFLDNDPSQPVILPFQLAHPNSEYTPKKEDGRVKRIRHNGILIEWDKDSNLTIDASEAAKNALKEKGIEDSASGSGGQIKIITSDGTNKTSIHLNEQGKILLGSDPSSAATEPLVCGNLWISIMKELIDAILALTVGTGVGPSSTPINFAAFQSIKSKIDAKQHVSDFIFTKKAY